MQNVTLGFEHEAARPLIQGLGIVKQDEFYCMAGDVNVTRLREWEAALIAARKSLGLLDGWELFTQDMVQGERIGSCSALLFFSSADFKIIVSELLSSSCAPLPIHSRDDLDSRPPHSSLQGREPLGMCLRARGTGRRWRSRRSSPTPRSNFARTFLPRPTS
jgi:hypothetical protein